MIWDNFSDAASDRMREQVIAARHDSVGAWSMLASASDREDFINRLEIVRPSLERTAARHGAEVSAIEASMTNDFEVLLAARSAAIPVKDPVKAPAKTAAVKLSVCATCFDRHAGNCKTANVCPICHNGSDTAEHMAAFHHKDVSGFWNLDGFSSDPWGYDDGGQERSKRQANHQAVKKTAARIHQFNSSGEAYDRCQTDPSVKTGDVLHIPSEGVVGYADTWPVAVTANPGNLHHLKHPEAGPQFEAPTTCRSCGGTGAPVSPDHNVCWRCGGNGTIGGDKPEEHEARRDGWIAAREHARRNRLPLHTSENMRSEGKSERPFEAAKKTYEHIDAFLSWSKKNGHDPDSLSTLKSYERSAPGIGRATADKIADEYHLEGDGWRDKEKVSREAKAQAEVSSEAPHTEAHSDAHTAASNFYEPEYEGGLECRTCSWTGFTETQRNAHEASHNPTARPKSRVKRAVSRILTAGDTSNILSTCPICGRQIPAHEMVNHMKREHPHEAPRMDDLQRSAAEATETTEPSSVPVVPTLPSTVDPSMSPVQDMQTPENIMAQAKIAADLAVLNPGLDPKRAMVLAAETLRRYPELAKQARGGADYIDGETLVACPQCGKDAYSDESSHCHNCGAVFA